MATSSDNLQEGKGKPSVIHLPAPVEYVSSYEQILRQAKERALQPPLDILGRKRKDENVEVNQDDRKLLLFRDHRLDFPELNFRVHLLGPPEDTRGFSSLFARAFCTKADGIADADLVVFTGGPDVDPAYYGEKPIEHIYLSEERDYQDIGAYLTCAEAGIPMLGVCRGAQFLAVMGGFKLIQDLDNHQTDHQIYDRKACSIIENVSSRHHQAVIPGEGMEVLATAFKSTRKTLAPGKEYIKEPNKGVTWPSDVEAYFIRETCCIGIQGHPEYKGYNKFAQWSLELLEKYIILNEDVTWVGDRRRLRPELLEERQLRLHSDVKEEKRKVLTPKMTVDEIGKPINMLGEK